MGQCQPAHRCCDYLNIRDLCRHSNDKRIVEKIPSRRFAGLRKSEAARVLPISSTGHGLTVIKMRVVKRRDGVEGKPTEWHARDRQRKTERIGPFGFIEKSKDRSNAEGNRRKCDEHDQNDALVFETRPSAHVLRSLAGCQYRHLHEVDTEEAVACHHQTNWLYQHARRCPDDHPDQYRSIKADMVCHVLMNSCEPRNLE